MLRPRPLATVIAALALLAGALFFAPIAATQNGASRLSPTPPVRLAPPPHAPASTPATPKQLPPTGLDTWLVCLAGIGLLAAGTALRGVLAARASHGSG